MTAIGGYWAFEGSVDPEDMCGRTLAAQKLFGPHDTALAADGCFALGRNLYRLLPEDAHDRQPERTADGALTLVADVRLDNRPELAADLALAESDAAGLSDAALLLQALSRWGEGTLDRLVGAYAFAAWDAAAGRLLLARDPIGHRPLCYHRARHGFAFASMPRGLLALPGVPAEPDEERAARFLALMPETGPETFYKAIRRVVPGECVIVTRTGETRRRYWDPKGPAPDAGRDEGDERDVEDLRREFERAVAACLRGSDGHVAAQLSGGLDSSAVTVTAARILAASGGRVTAFTAVPAPGRADGAFPGRVPDEGPMAASTAAMYPNVECVLVTSGDGPAAALLDEDVDLHERPSLNPFNMVWIDAINAAARARKLRVMLTGQMGNLTISYPGWERLPALLGRGGLSSFVRLAKELRATSGLSAGMLVSMVLHPWLDPLVPRGWRRRRLMRRTLALSAIEPGPLSKLLASDPAQRAEDSAAIRSRALTSVDPGNFNKAVLAKFGVDTRDPTADRRVIELCLSLPLSAFAGKGGTRRLARRLLQGAVPGALLAERRKGVQAADWHLAVEAARPAIEQEVALIAGSPAASRVIDVARLNALLADWPVDWTGPATMRNYRLALTRALAVGHFLRRAEEANGAGIAA